MVDGKVPVALGQGFIGAAGRHWSTYRSVDVQVPCGGKLEGHPQAVAESGLQSEFCYQIFGVRKTVVVCHIVESSVDTVAEALPRAVVQEEAYPAGTA